MKIKLTVFVVIIAFFQAKAQQPATTSNLVQNALKNRQLLHKNSLVKNVPFVNIGPTIMSGRVVDIEANPENPNEFYVAYASGGVWHTINNGSTFTPVLDTSNTQNVGDIAIDWNNKTIWVGTGENNSSRSSYAGIGILKSTNNGITWHNVGLHDSQHIGRILINPNNPDEVTVGVVGHLYSENKERGIYKTKDGGKTWKQTLFVDSLSGVIDLQYVPNNYNIMFASSWTRDRKAWHFNGSGKNSAIYKSEDAGETWVKISTETSGFPTGEGVGRIGLAVYDNAIIYALHDNQNRRALAREKTKTNNLVKEDFKTMSTETFLNLTDKDLNSFLKMNGFQEKYRAENVKQLVRSGNVKPIDLAHYLEDANAMLFDTPVIGAEVYKSIDGGITWKKTHDYFLDDLYYSYGYYFGEIRVDPQDQDKIYVLGVPILKSNDAGKTFTSIGKENVHVDHQALWVNPKKSGHLIDGNDGGLNISYDDGESWEKLNVNSVGQFYTINVDNNTPYNVYGGLQDNGVWVGANNAQQNKAWQQYGKNPWESIMGGDGMQIQIDPRDANIVYTGYQFGNYYRIDRNTNKSTYIQPKHQLGEKPYRFNWQTPICLSSHNPDILYLGANKLMRSMNKGDDWTAISNDLTKGGKKGNVAYGTLTTISESPFQFGLIYTGSDDGLVQLTKDAGASWQNISESFPKDLWVSRVIASKHKKERVYVTLNGYRWDDFNSYVYVSENHGETWKNISSNIAISPVNVILEDTQNENILYLGTDNAAYVSFNKGEKWEIFSKGLPAVAVHDMVIQPRTKDLLIATHGRSIYKTNIAALQEMDSNLLSTKLKLFSVENIPHSSRWGNSWSKWDEAIEPTQNITFYTSVAGEKEIQIRSQLGTILNTIPVLAATGFNNVKYNLTLTEKGRKALLKENTSIDINQSKNDKYYLPKGEYTIQIDAEKVSFEIK